MSSPARFLDLEDDEPPPSGIRRTASIVVLEPDDDLASALLEVCDEPVPASRLLPVRLIPRAAG